MRKAVHTADIIAIFFIGWIGLSALPLSLFWFDPGPVVIQDAKEGESPKIGFSRDIKRNVVMQYSVVIRDANLAVYCEDRSAPIEYRSDSQLPEDLDLAWWAFGTEACHRPPVGSYIVTTCWTATGRLLGLLRDKTVCVQSNVFKIT